MGKVRRFGWFAVLVLVALLATACGSKQPEPAPAPGKGTDQTTQGSTAPKDQPAATSPTPGGNDAGDQDAGWNGQTVTVTIEQGEFKPSSLTVKRGTKVVWENADTDMHNADFSSTDLKVQGPIMQPGTGKWSLVMTKTGTFEYVCTIHPFMKASVTVEE